MACRPRGLWNVWCTRAAQLFHVSSACVLSLLLLHMMIHANLLLQGYTPAQLIDEDEIKKMATICFVFVVVVVVVQSNVCNTN